MPPQGQSTSASVGFGSFWIILQKLSIYLMWPCFTHNVEMVTFYHSPRIFILCQNSSQHCSRISLQIEVRWPPSSTYSTSSRLWFPQLFARRFDVCQPPTRPHSLNRAKWKCGHLATLSDFAASAVLIFPATERSRKVKRGMKQVPLSLRPCVINCVAITFLSCFTSDPASPMPARIAGC